MIRHQGRNDILMIEETENQGDESYGKEQEIMWFLENVFHM